MPIHETIREASKNAWEQVRSTMFATFDLPHDRHTSANVLDAIIPDKALQRAVDDVIRMAAENITRQNMLCHIRRPLADGLYFSMAIVWPPELLGRIILPYKVSMAAIPECPFKTDIVALSDQMLAMFIRTGKARNVLNVAMAYSDNVRQLKTYWPRLPMLFTHHHPNGRPAMVNRMIDKWDAIKPSTDIQTWPGWREDLALLDEVAGLYAVIKPDDISQATSQVRAPKDPARYVRASYSINYKQDTRPVDEDLRDRLDSLVSAPLPLLV